MQAVAGWQTIVQSLFACLDNDLSERCSASTSSRCAKDLSGQRSSTHMGLRSPLESADEDA